MNKTFLTPFTILCLLSTMFLVGIQISVSGTTDLPVHNVDTGLDYATIQGAIDAPETLNGHTIMVDSGTYYERFWVSKSITLIGQDKETTVIDGNGTGTINVAPGTAVTIRNFTIQNHDSGLSLWSSENFTVIQNIIRNNKVGIFLLGTSINCNISENEISENLEYGVYIDGGVNFKISMNTISDNVGIGIYLDDTQYSTIVGNTFKNNDGDGIRLLRFSNSTFFRNTLKNNTIGIGLFASSNDNTIYQNNFIDNTVQVNTINSVNIWDYDYEGNYWSDYNGTDICTGPYQNQTGRDGLGDTPHIIDRNNQDNYPLMGVFSDFNATSEYHVQTICNSTISDLQFNGTGVCFDVTGEDGTVSFCRICIPIGLMNGPYKVFVNDTEISHSFLHFSNSTHSYLYFAYNHSSQKVIIATAPPSMYYELLEKYLLLLASFNNLNSTYYELLDSYSKLQSNHNLLNSTYSELIQNYTLLQESFDSLMRSYSDLQEQHNSLNSTYSNLLTSYNNLLTSYNSLYASYNELISRQEDIINELNTNRNLMYVFIATTIILIATTVYFVVRKAKTNHKLTRAQPIVSATH